jgi:hypothetical protein
MINRGICSPYFPRFFVTTLEYRICSCLCILFICVCVCVCVNVYALPLVAGLLLRRSLYTTFVLKEFWLIKEAQHLNYYNRLRFSHEFDFSPASIRWALLLVAKHVISIT